MRRPETRKVWVEVEVPEPQPGGRVLLGAVDPVAAREALRDLRDFHVEDPPEGVFCDWNPNYTPGDEDAAFFTEAFLYTLLGKEDARSLLHRVRMLEVALGLEEWDEVHP